MLGPPPSLPFVGPLPFSFPKCCGVGLPLVQHAEKFSRGGVLCGRAKARAERQESCFLCLCQREKEHRNPGLGARSHDIPGPGKIMKPRGREAASLLQSDAVLYLDKETGEALADDGERSVFGLMIPLLGITLSL